MCKIINQNCLKKGHRRVCCFLHRRSQFQVQLKNQNYSLKIKDAKLQGSVYAGRKL